MAVFLDYPSTFPQYLDHTQIEKTVLVTLNHQDISMNADLSIVFADDAHLQQLNREFQGIDKSTDVLSFPAGHIDPDTNQTYLGDVIISLPTASSQANQAGHTISSEIILLIVHGVLHLLGHDHMSPDEKSAMWSAQDEILESLGLNIQSPEFSSEPEG